MMSIEHDVGDSIEWMWVTENGCIRMNGIVTEVQYHSTCDTTHVMYMAKAAEEFREDTCDTYCVDQDQTFSRRE